MDNRTSHKIIDRTASIFLILFVMSWLLTLSGLLGRLLYREEFFQISLQKSLVYSIYAIFGYAVYIGAAVWLFIEAQKTDGNKWLWATLGLFGGLMAIILWYLRKMYSLFAEMQKSIAEKSKQTDSSESIATTSE
jgi:hypothetical protein